MGETSGTPVLDRLKAEFTLDKATMERIIDEFYQEMQQGLESYDIANKSSLKMIPTFVSSLPNGKETGTYYALDIGGTNFRVAKFVFDGKGSFEADEHKFTIPKELMLADKAEDLFDFLADSILSVGQSEDGADVEGEEGGIEKSYGFTFSFPVKQTAIDKGYLMNWTKGFKTKGVEGEEVVGLLTAALDRKTGGSSKGVKIKALVNDTVGTLASGKYSKPNCAVGIILGTGTNAAYIEKTKNIKKLFDASNGEAEARKHEDFGEEMAINMEWGAFGDVTRHLPLTAVDNTVDEQSINPGQQHFEKMISGLYLGEVARLCLCDLLNGGELFRDSNECADVFKTGSFSQLHGFDTAYLSQIEGGSYEKLGQALGKALGDADRKAFADVSHFVVERAARLTCCGILALLKQLKNNGHQSISVGIDGSVFEKTPTFNSYLTTALKEFECEIEVFLTKDGSGCGAALIASSQDKQIISGVNNGTLSGDTKEQIKSSPEEITGPSKTSCCGVL